MDESKIKEVERIVEEACKKESNYFGIGIWTHHIKYVVKYSKLLAKKLNADEEVLELAALLHDYASVFNYELYPEHHIHSAKLSGEILSKLDFQIGLIEKVKLCILTHRGSLPMQKQTREAEILASADALAHFDSVNSLLYLAFTKHKMSIDDGTKWVLDKLERSWNKLMPEAKELISDKYNSIKEAFKD